MTDTCGATKKDGTPCKQMDIYSNGRCKFHGGLATGPTSEAGKEQSRINGRKGGRPRKDGATSTTGKVSVMMIATFSPIRYQGFHKGSRIAGVDFIRNRKPKSWRLIKP